MVKPGSRPINYDLLKRIKPGVTVAGKDAKGTVFQAVVISQPSPFSFVLDDGKITPLSLIQKVVKDADQSRVRPGQRDNRGKATGGRNGGTRGGASRRKR